VRCPRPLHPPVGGPAAVRGVVLPQDGEQVCPPPRLPPSWPQIPPIDAPGEQPGPMAPRPPGGWRAHAPAGCCPAEWIRQQFASDGVSCRTRRQPGAVRCMFSPSYSGDRTCNAFRVYHYHSLSVNGQCLNGFENVREISEKKGRECQCVKRSGNAHT